MAENGKKSGLSSGLKWTASLLWAGFWTLGGLGAGFDPTNDTGIIAGIGLAIGFGIIPMIPLWWTWWKGRRKAPQPPHGWDAVRDLPPRLYDPWRRLLGAKELVTDLADQGWIEERSVAQLDSAVETLRELATADHKTDTLGGKVSQTVYRRIEELTMLLVALADEAVEHRAVVTTDGQIPATLTEARKRLHHTRSAYQDLEDLTDRSGTVDPETADNKEVD